VAGHLGAVTVVVVHGVPETDAVWQPLRNALGRDDVVTLSPPGFGAPVPEGFGATVTEYRDWLVGERASTRGAGGRLSRSTGWAAA
jgi:pimeloyl-ACP methyl ester carboxylesterase